MLPSVHKGDQDHILALRPVLRRQGVEPLCDTVHLLPVVAPPLIVELDNRKLIRRAGHEAAEGLVLRVRHNPGQLARLDRRKAPETVVRLWHAHPVPLPFFSPIKKYFTSASYTPEPRLCRADSGTRSEIHHSTDDNAGCPSERVRQIRLETVPPFVRGKARRRDRRGSGCPGLPSASTTSCPERRAMRSRMKENVAKGRSGEPCHCRPARDGLIRQDRPTASSTTWLSRQTLLSVQGHAPMLQDGRSSVRLSDNLIEHPRSQWGARRHVFRIAQGHLLPRPGGRGLIMRHDRVITGPVSAIARFIAHTTILDLSAKQHSVCPHMASPREPAIKQAPLQTNCALLQHELMSA
jgi:hypothetical protein